MHRHILVYIHIYVCMYIYIYMCIYTYTYVNICISLYGYIFNTFASRCLFFSIRGGRGSRKCATPLPVEGVRGFVIFSIAFYCGTGVLSCGG